MLPNISQLQEPESNIITVVILVANSPTFSPYGQAVVDLGSNAQGLLVQLLPN